jgi:predicted transcriptional regulator
VKPGKYKAIEAERGKPIRELLIELFEKHGSTKKVAKELGVSQSTLSTWLSIHGLKLKTILVVRSKESGE